MKLLFVCLGNICRSPTAEGVFRTLAPHLEVDSCGIGAWHVGKPPDPRTIAHAARRGYDLSTLRARQISSEDFGRFDHVIAMDRSVLKSLCGRGVLFLDDGDVPDPYTGSAADFERVLDLVEEGARRWIARLGR